MIDIINYIINNINTIYENINIIKAVFIINPELTHTIYEKLKENEYPVCLLKDSNRFIDNKSRIILIEDTDIDNIHQNNKLYLSLKLVNLVIFIDTPKIKDNNFYKNYFGYKVCDNNFNIFEI